MAGENGMQVAAPENDAIAEAERRGRAAEAVHREDAREARAPIVLAEDIMVRR